MVKKLVECPFCNNNNVQKMGKKFYLCENCGCVYNAEENNKVLASLTKISKEEFFSIIFNAFQALLGNKLDFRIKREIEKEFSVKVHTYYKEIANLYAEAIYEIDSDAKENSLYDLLS